MGNDGLQVDAQACHGLCVCVASCAAGALSLVRAPERWQPLEIHELIAE